MAKRWQEDDLPKHTNRAALVLTSRRAKHSVLSPAPQTYFQSTCCQKYVLIAENTISK
jgi:hypothetical protein